MNRAVLVVLFIVGCTGFWLLAAASGIQDTAPEGQAVWGQKLYMKNMCYTCHGTAGQGGERVGPKLAPNPVSFSWFTGYLRKPLGYMPPYRSEFLSDRDLADIYAYLRSIKPNPETRNLPLPDF